MFIKSLKKSDVIIVIGRDMLNFLEGVYADGLIKTKYIPLWQDERMISPGEFITNNFVKKLKLEDKFVVQYSGNMGLWNELKTIGEAVKQNTEEITFMFVGGGMRKSELFEPFLSKDSKNVISLPFQPNDELGSLLSACHIALVSLRSGLEGMAVPSKIYGILAAGIPIIALVPSKSEIAMIVEEENCGIVVDPIDVNGLIRAIQYLKSEEIIRSEMGKRARNAFENKYTTKIIASEYKKLILNLNQQAK